MILLKAMSFYRPPPANLQPGDAAVFSAQGGCHCDMVMARMLDAAAFNPSGELFADGDVLAESFIDERQYLRRDVKRFRNRAAESLSAPLFGPRGSVWICDRHSHNYHHWFADALPRLEAWLGVRGSATVVLPRRVAEQPFVAESLAAYPEAEFLAGPETLARLEGLILVGKVSPPGRHHDWLAGKVAERMRAHFAGDVTPGAALLHVSRREARFRRIANEAEAAEVFARHGVQTVVLEGRTLKEQLRLLASARFLAGPHGAGLSNMLFMLPGGTVLELRQPEGPPLCFLELAAGRRHAWRYLACEPADPLAHPHAADILVNPEALDLELGQALA